jgi:5'-nucleotidase
MSGHTGMPVIMTPLTLPLPMALVCALPMPPLILITNDDGIHSPGLRAAVTALAGLGERLVVAPTGQQSGMSRSLPAWFDGRIAATTLETAAEALPAYHLAGSPAQAVLYGVLEIAPRLYGRWPDLVVSGINYGENLGSNTMISGTVGAALQAGDMGIRSLAVSLETHKAYHLSYGQDVDWSGASYWLRYFARLALKPLPWPPDVAALKIDLPATVTPQTPWRLTRQSRQPYFVARVVPGRDLSAAEPLDYEVAIDPTRLEPLSDIAVFAQNRHIAVTPLSTDLTARLEGCDDLTVGLARFEALLRQQESV